MKYTPLPFLFILFCSAFISCTKENDLTTPQQQNTSEERLPGPPLITSKAQWFNHLFTRYGGGWTGGDATYSVPLPGGKTLWMFGDTFLDTVYPDRSRPVSGLIRNSFVIQQGTTMTTLYGGTQQNPVSFVDTGNPDFWYWPLDGTVQNNKLYVYFALFHTTGNGIFDFEYVRTDLMRFSLPSVTLENITTVSTDPDVHYGSCVCEDNGYLCIFGDESFSITKYAHAARVPLNNLYAPWEYWDGTTWGSIPPPLAQGRIKRSNTQYVDVSQEFSVFYWQGKYRLVTQEGLLGPHIYSYESNSLTGPFTNKTLVYVTPETGGNIWTYNAFVHPEFAQQNKLLLSYNINSMNFANVFANADTYRPKFIWFQY